MRFGGVTVPQGYEAAFQRAIWTFQHQRVFDSLTKQIVHLRPLPEGGLCPTPGIADVLQADDQSLDFLGPPLTDAIASEIAAGSEELLKGEFLLNPDSPS